MDLKMTLPEIMEFLEDVFPQVTDDFIYVDLEPMEVVMGLRAADQHLRPGGTVSGPSMFALADVSAYVAILSMLGPVALAVTTNCSIDFMRKPPPGQLLCRMQILKLGRSLAVCEGRLFGEGAETKPVARASLTYSIPPN